MSGTVLLHRSSAVRVGVILALGASLVLLVGVSTASGAVRLSLAQLVDAVRGGEHAFVVQQYRLPRVGTAVLAGGALAISGTLLQRALRNPLASPDVIGVTKGAGLGAMTASLLVPPALVPWAIPFGAIGGVVLVTALLMVVVRLVGSRGATIALVGMAMAALAGAGVEFLMMRYSHSADQALVWLAGSVYGATGDEVVRLGAWLLCCMPAVVLCARRLDLSAFDDDSQVGLGVSPSANRALLVVTAAALATGAVTAVGGIGFIGLLAPHVARIVVGHGARWSLLATALVGAILLLLSDLLGRVVAVPNEVPAGIVAAVVGGPCLLVLLLREARRDA